MATRPPLGNQPNARDLESRQYQEAVNRLKGNRFQAGSQEYNNNFNTIKTLGTKYGYNWQQYQPKPTQPAQPAPTGQWAPSGQAAPATPPPTGGGLVGAAPGYMSLNRDQAIRKYQEAVNRIKNNRFAAGSQEYNNNAAIIRDLGGKYGFNWQQHIGANWQPAAVSTTAQPPSQGQAPASPPPADGAPADPTSDASNNPDDFFNNYQSPMSKFLLEALKNNLGQLPAYTPGANPDDNTMRAYEPQFFEGSPMYQFQKQKGLSDLEKLMASRGLTNSGAELQANSDFLANINAQEAEKQRGYAEAEAERKRRAIETETARRDAYDRDKANRVQNAINFISDYDQKERENLRNQYNTNQSRRDQVGMFEANRADAEKQAARNFMLSILGMQAQNPISGEAFKGLGESSAYGKALMDAMAGYAANNYTRVRAPGGGGGSLPPARPMDTSNFDIMKILMGAANNADSNALLNSILGSIK